MTTATTASAVAAVSPALSRVYDELDVGAEDRLALRERHSVLEFKDLIPLKQQLLRKQLAGVSSQNQSHLAFVVDYAREGCASAVGSSLNNKNKKRRSDAATAALDGDTYNEDEDGSAAAAAEQFLLDNFTCASFQDWLVKEVHDLEFDNEDENENDGTGTGAGGDGDGNGRTFHSGVTNLGRRSSSALVEEEFDDDERYEFDDDFQDDVDSEEENEKRREVEDLLNKVLPQGFRPESSMRPDVGSGVNGGGGGASSSESDDETKEESVVENGKTYRLYRCYRYKNGGTVAIVEFCRPKLNVRGAYREAFCVLILPTSDTFLCMSGGNDKCKEKQAPAAPEKFFQTNLKQTIPLSHLTEECDEPAEIPDEIYELQQTGSWRTFAYLRDNMRRGVNRVGKREGKPRVVDFFAGCGGMDLGYQAAGYETAVAVEMNENAVKTFQHNNPDVDVFCGDVNVFLSKYGHDAAFREGVGRVDVLHASSPCQGFSGANRGGGQNDERNNDLSLAFVNGLRLMKPPVGVFENVPGMWSRKHIEYLHEIVSQVQEMDYQVRCSELIARDYGDPQTRKRLFIVAVKSHIPMPSLPAKTHGVGQVPFVTCKDVLHGFLAGDAHERYENMEGSSSNMTDGRDVVVLKPDGYAPTIRASGTKPFHYAEFRPVNVREAASLQSFPTWYKIKGTLGSQYRQVGNAVPVGLATAVALSLKPSLEYVYEEDNNGGGRDSVVFADDDDADDDDSVEIVDMTTDNDDGGGEEEEAAPGNVGAEEAPEDKGAEEEGAYEVVDMCSDIEDQQGADDGIHMEETGGTESSDIRTAMEETTAYIQQMDV